MGFWRPADRNLFLSHDVRHVTEILLYGLAWPKDRFQHLRHDVVGRSHSGSADPFTSSSGRALRGERLEGVQFIRWLAGCELASGNSQTGAPSRTETRQTHRGR